MPIYAPTATKSRVLVVEDEMLLAWDIEDTLRQDGYEIAGTAVSVEAAFDLISAKTIDVAILDFNMRGQMTVPLAYELKRRGIPFIICTAYNNLVEMERVTFQDITILHKPVTPDTLLKELNRTIECNRVAPKSLKNIAQTAVGLSRFNTAA